MWSPVSWIGSVRFFMVLLPVFGPQTLRPLRVVPSQRRKAEALVARPWVVGRQYVESLESARKMPFHPVWPLRG